MNKKLLLSSLLLATVIPFYSLTLVGCSKESSKKTPNELFNQIYKENINNNVIFDNQKAILVRNGWNNDTIDTNINLNYIDNWIKTNFNISENNYFRDNNSIKIVQDTFDQKFLKHLFNVDDIEEFFNSLNLNINEYLNIEFLLSIDKCYHDENEPQKFIYILTLQKILINGLKQDINNIGFDINKKFNINIYCDAIFPSNDGELIELSKLENDYKLNSFLLNNVYKIVVNHYGGTISSFYIDVDNEKEELHWYLITNFHIARHAINLYSDEQINEIGLLAPYKSSPVGSIQIIRQKDNEEEVITSWNTNTNLISMDNLTIWTDCSPWTISENSKDELNLFSNKVYENSMRYNIDAGLFEITFSFDNLIKNPKFVEFFVNVSGSYNCYLRNNNLGKVKPYENSPYQKRTAFMGFPRFKYDHFYDIDGISNGYNITHTWVGLDNKTQMWFDWVRYSPSYVPSAFNPGASGSPVWWYVNNGKEDIIEPVMYAIYYGKSGKRPIFMAFQSDLYNIYENFRAFLAIKDQISIY